MPRIYVIFDVDGTLVDTEAFEGDLYWKAIREVLGDVKIRPDWRQYEHVTDSGILRDVCGDNDVEYSGFSHAVRLRFGELVAEHVGERARCPPITGALSFWNALRGNPDVEIGIATGGWGHTARMKLDAAGYAYPGVAFGSSDNGHERVSIMRHCRQQISAATPTVYIGDGEWDVMASKQLGWRFIGVGERLRGKCEEWIADFHAGASINLA